MLYSQKLRVNYGVPDMAAGTLQKQEKDSRFRHASANYTNKMNAFDMPQIDEAHRRNGELYHEFLRSNRSSLGLYVLEAQATDPQVPHTEDEIYYVVCRGRE